MKLLKLTSIGLLSILAFQNIAFACPGRGYWQIEQDTHDDLWKSFLSRSANKELADQLKLMLGGRVPDVDICQNNHVYAAAMATQPTAGLNLIILKSGKSFALVSTLILNKPLGS